MMEIKGGNEGGAFPASGSGHSPKGGAAISVASPAKPSVPNEARLRFSDWIRRLDEDVIRGEYGYEEGEFTVFPDQWRPLWREGLTPEQAFRRAIDAHAERRREEDAVFRAGNRIICIDAEPRGDERSHVMEKLAALRVGETYTVREAYDWRAGTGGWSLILEEVETPFPLSWNSRRFVHAAIATEAGTATTVKQGVVHEGAGAKHIAQKASQ